MRPLDDEPRDIGGQHDPRGDDAPAPVLGKHREEPVEQTAGEHDHRGDDPVPRGLGVEHQYGEVGKVQQVREVEHLSMVRTTQLNTALNTSISPTGVTTVTVRQKKYSSA